MTAPDLLAGFEAAARRFVAGVAAVDLTAVVPTCPGWTVLDLSRHLGTTWRWAADNAAAAGETVTRPDDADAPSDPMALRAWLSDGADATVRRLRTLPPDQSCWAIGVRPHTVQSWYRRMAHETAVHVADVRSAAGLDPVLPDLDDELAVDGIAEALEVFLPGRRRRGTVADVGTIELEVPGARFVVATGSEDVASGATVSGPAPVVLLALWGRVGLTDARLTVAGDAAAAAAVLAAGVVP